MFRSSKSTIFWAWIWPRRSFQGFSKINLRFLNRSPYSWFKIKKSIIRHYLTLTFIFKVMKSLLLTLDSWVKPYPYVKLPVPLEYGDKIWVLIWKTKLTFRWPWKWPLRANRRSPSDQRHTFLWPGMYFKRYWRRRLK